MKKETLEKIKSGLKKAGTGILLFASGTTLFTACNKTGQTTPTPTPGPDPDNKPPVVVTMYSVTDILSEMQAFTNLDIQASYDSLASSIAAEKLFQASVLGYDSKGNTLSIVAKSKNGGDLTSVSVSVPNSAMKYANMNESALKAAVLELAGYTQTSEVEDKTEAEQKLTAAINKMIADIAAGKDCSTIIVNDYAVEGSNINLARIFPNSTVKGYVREDDSVLAYVYDENGLTEHLYRFTEKGLYPDEKVQVIETGVKGVDYTEAVVAIDLTRKHTQPALEEQQVETVSFDELYAQVFGDNYTLPSFGELMQETIEKITVGETKKVLFTGFDGDDFYIYSEIGDETGIKMFVKSLYKGEGVREIIEYRDKISPFVEQGDLKQTLKELHYDGQEINEYTIDYILMQLEYFKVNSEGIASRIRNLTKADFKNTNIFTTTKSLNNQKEFAQKLFDDKEIIYAGVSDLGGKSIDRYHFDTGYYDNFKILSIYAEGGDIIINIKEIYVPWYNNSTNESLYDSFLTDNKYEIVSESTITITDPVEVQRLAEFMSKMERFAQFDIDGLEGLAESEDEANRIKHDASLALWNSMR